MSRALEYAQKYAKYLRSIETPPEAPASFGILWPGGGQKIAWVKDDGDMALKCDLSIDAGQALKLAAWIEHNFRTEPKP